MILSNSAKFQVTGVRLSPDSKVYHFGEFVEGSFQPNDTVQLKKDSDLRVLHAKAQGVGAPEAKEARVTQLNGFVGLRRHTR